MASYFVPTPFWHYIPAFKLAALPKLRVLDFGCGKGEFIGEVGKKTKWAYGYDVDVERIRVARQNFPHVKFKNGQIGRPLPFASSSFDVITMFHVLEHVGSEKEAIFEAHRILKKGGLLLLASPYSGFFAWADAANIRYRFPHLHKWFFIRFLGKSEYERRFVNHQSIGMFGDCTGNRNWHKHYTEVELRHQLRNKFTITKFYKFSLFYPFLLIPYNILNYLFKPKFNPVLWLIHVDNLINAGEWSYNFLVVAKKNEMVSH